jgi:hypothetical protein
MKNYLKHVTSISVCEFDAKDTHFKIREIFAFFLLHIFCSSSYKEMCFVSFSCTFFGTLFYKSTVKFVGFAYVHIGHIDSSMDLLISCTEIDAYTRCVRK